MTIRWSDCPWCRSGTTTRKEEIHGKRSMAVTVSKQSNDLLINEQLVWKFGDQKPNSELNHNMMNHEFQHCLESKLIEVMGMKIHLIHVGPIVNLLQT
jgi:hypothetical protein